MRVSKAEAERSRRRIIDTASRLVRELGIEAISIGEIMAGAGLTHGGFYRHFESKEAILEAALTLSFDQMIARLAAAGASPEGAVAGLRSEYLSDAHVQEPGSGCPVAALGGEVGRESTGIRTAFAAGVSRMISVLAGPDGSPAARQAAFREFSMLVGAVVIARAGDSNTASEVLAACRSARSY